MIYYDIYMYNDNDNNNNDLSIILQIEKQRQNMSLLVTLIFVHGYTIWYSDTSRLIVWAA